ncbi:hypothetical protein GCM10010431_80820 [Streptomyces kunmingensis]
MSNGSFFISLPDGPHIHGARDAGARPPAPSPLKVLIGHLLLREVAGGAGADALKTHGAAVADR